MKQFFLAEITTKDKLIHQGLFYKPSKPGTRAILWVHGLTDNFYGDLPTIETFAVVCEKEGWGLASFNTRGHDIVASGKKLDPKSPKGQASLTIGSAIEQFSDCIYDIDAGITFLVNQGFSKIVLVGISTGANKVCYYAGKIRDSRVAGVVLASPISDVTLKLKELGNKYVSMIKKIKAMVNKGKGDRILDGLDYMPLTPQRYLSLYSANSDEDVFPYYQINPKFTIFSNIKIPMMVVFGAADEYSDRPVEQILKVLNTHQRSINFSGAIIPGAYHSFSGREKELADSIVHWINTIK